MMPKRLRLWSKVIESGPQLGLAICYPAPGIIEQVGSEWDWIWIDGQHGQFGYQDLLAAARACNFIDRPAVIRVPGHDPGPIGLALDMAIDGVMVPMVNTAEEARQIVQAAKFHPLGSRSFGGRRVCDLFGPGYAQAPIQPLLICQIETQIGLENAEAIAAVEGVDVLFFGADDMAISRGLTMGQVPPGSFDAARMQVSQAAKRQGKFCGGVFVAPEAAAQAVSMGYNLLVGGVDVFFLLLGSAERAKMLRPIINGNRKADAVSSSDGIMKSDRKDVSI
jgi:2-keto-3-deoxy-L-rhamnonate aldolase RhmA